MALAKQIVAKESVQELKTLMRKQPLYLKSRVQMLLVLKKSDGFLSKEARKKIYFKKKGNRLFNIKS